jgi:hypothetical protein
MDARALAAVLRRLGAKLDRLARLVDGVHEQLAAIDVKLDALLLDEARDDSSETIDSSSSASESDDVSDMSFVVDDHSSSGSDTVELDGNYVTSPSSSA